MDDAGFEYLDLDAELQAALPKDGKVGATFYILHDMV